MQALSDNFSVLRDPYSKPPRPLWKALADCMMSARVGDQDRQFLLAKLLRDMRMADRMRVNVELTALRMERRGELNEAAALRRRLP